MIVDVHELSARQGNRDDSGKVIYRRRFEVIVDDPLDDVLTVINSTDIPQFGDVYEAGGNTDPAALVVRIDPRQDENPYLWFIDVEYGSRNVDRTRIDYHFETIQEAVEHDLDGKMVRNSAGMPFSPPPERDRGRLVITMMRKEVGFNPFAALKYMFKVNSVTWNFWGLAARRVLCADIRASDLGEGGGKGLEHQVTYVFKVGELYLRRDPQGHIDPVVPPTLSAASEWDLRLLDAGTHERVAGSLRPIMLFGSREITTPYPLNGSGLKHPTDPNDAAFVPVYRTFRIYDSVDFNDLNLP